jgi:hypothetical protein
MEERMVFLQATASVIRRPQQFFRVVIHAGGESIGKTGSRQPGKNIVATLGNLGA